MTMLLRRRVRTVCLFAGVLVLLVAGDSLLVAACGLALFVVAGVLWAGEGA